MGESHEYMSQQVLNELQHLFCNEQRYIEIVGAVNVTSNIDAEESKKVMKVLETFFKHYFDSAVSAWKSNTNNFVAAHW